MNARYVSQRRRSILVARLDGEEPGDSDGIGPCPTTGFRFISSLRASTSSITQASGLSMEQAHDHSRAPRNEVICRLPRRGSILLVSAGSDQDKTVNSDLSIIQPTTVVAGIRFLRSKQTSFRLGCDKLVLFDLIWHSTSNTNNFFHCRKNNRRISLSKHKKSDSSEDESFNISKNEEMLKVARMLATTKLEVSQQALKCQILAAWKIIVATRFTQPLFEATMNF